ncbi:MAG: beta-propeller domain-containing protein, partial [Steroidobacteraceae bacterium]
MQAEALVEQGAQIMRKLLILSVVSLLAVGCSSGGGDDSGRSGDASFLTADVHGLSAGLSPGAGIPGPPGGSADFGVVADAAREEIVRAIEEADLYRVSGDLLYLLSAYRGLTIVNLSQLELLGRLPLQGVPLEMYLRGGRAFVLLADLQGATQLLEAAIADPTQPAISGTETMTGAYRTSRLIGDVLYAVTDQEVRSFRVDATPFSPGSSLALGEIASFAHATSSFIFISGSNADNGTTIRLVDISDPAGAMALRGALDLPGYLGDDQKLNFGGGVLRVVTHDWTDSGLSRLFTIDVSDPDAPAVLATLDLARGEQLFATQFTEDRAYLVTFEQVDPLWVIDLSDPARPVIAGELVVPGYSTQMVADGTQLVTIGVDPDLGWQTTISLFDVSNPAAPALLDREELGDSSSSALWERKAFAVYPNQILVPRWDGLAVVDRAADSLAPRGVIEVAGGALRGFPHGAGIVAVGAEEVVMADALTLNLIGRVTIAENVVDVGRLADGTLLRLVQAGNHARLGGAEVELWAEALYSYGNAAAIVGWDAAGRAAYVVTFDEDAPVVSARLDLNSGGVTAGGGVSGGAAAPDFVGGGAAIIAPVFSGPQAVLTSSGKLVLRGLPGGNPYVFGDGEPTDGVIVIDIPAAALSTGVAVRDAAITGLAADGTVLAFTIATFAGQDSLNRPLLQHDYLRIDLDTGRMTQPVGVPGYVVAATGSGLFTVEDLWGEDWSVTSHVVAARVASNAVEVLDRLALPAGAYDLRAAGTTLF